jgi:type VI secretion system protein ImpK
MNHLPGPATTFVPTSATELGHTRLLGQEHPTGTEEVPVFGSAGIALRGAYENPMLDAAAGLIGLAIRLGPLDRLADVPRLYDEVRNEIQTLLQEIRQLGYDDTNIRAYSYSLCLFLDERVMERPWGVESVWSHRSLLSEFHQETWGGEKFFTLMERLCAEAAKYQHVLEFMYYAVALGLKGKYAVHERGTEELQKILVRLHRIIRELRGPTPEFPDTSSNVTCAPVGSGPGGRRG